MQMTTAMEEAAARAVYEVPPRPGSAQESADLLADMCKNSYQLGGPRDPAVIAANQAKAEAADVNVASKKEKKRARAAEEAGGAESPKKKKKKAETPPGGEGGGGAAAAKEKKKKSPRLASLPADVRAEAMAAMASDDEGEGDDGDADFAPKKEKTTKWKREEVKRLEEVAGELEAEMELAAEELPLAVSELHEKAKQTNKGSIDRSLSHGAVVSADAVEDVSLVVSDWIGFLGESAPRYLNTDMVGQIQVCLHTLLGHPRCECEHPCPVHVSSMLVPTAVLRPICIRSPIRCVASDLHPISVLSLVCRVGFVVRCGWLL
jgi:hypothetical protein